MYYVYVLKSELTEKAYTGFTADLKKRVEEHNAGISFATKPYMPWKLIFYAALETKELAENFERYLKSGSGWAFARKRLLPQTLKKN